MKIKLLMGLLLMNGLISNAAPVAAPVIDEAQAAAEIKNACAILQGVDLAKLKTDGVNLKSLISNVPRLITKDVPAAKSSFDSIKNNIKDARTVLGAPTKDENNPTGYSKYKKGETAINVTEDGIKLFKNFIALSGTLFRTLVELNVDYSKVTGPILAQIIPQLCEGMQTIVDQEEVIALLKLMMPEEPVTPLAKPAGSAGAAAPSSATANPAAPAVEEDLFA